MRAIRILKLNELTKYHSPVEENKKVKAAE